MGLLLSRFIRKRPTTLEQLKKIEDGLRKIEDYKRSTERTQKKLIANIIVYSAALYILACVVVFVWYLPESWMIRLALLIPLILVPVIVYWLKWLISKYFNSKMVKANEQYADLQRKKKDIIDNVMETETFNKAKEILSKYAPEKLGKKETPQSSQAVAVSSSTDVRKRNLSHATASASALRPIVLSGQPNRSQSVHTNIKLQVVPQAPGKGGGSGEMRFHTQNSGFGDGRVPMPQPLFAKERGITDKLVEYIIGDGPGYRYALICKNCKGHNGMALKEEFPYMAFNCCYCCQFNAARSQRPMAPKLPEPPKPLALPSIETKPMDTQSLLNKVEDDKLEAPDTNSQIPEKASEETPEPGDSDDSDQKRNEAIETEETKEEKSDDDFQNIGFSESDLEELQNGLEESEENERKVEEPAEK